jgi:hypothetical protein
MATATELAAWLSEAEIALHRLMTGSRMEGERKPSGPSAVHNQQRRRPGTLYRPASAADRNHHAWQPEADPFRIRQMIQVISNTLRRALKSVQGGLRLSAEAAHQGASLTGRRLPGAALASAQWERIPALTAWGRRRVIHVHDNRAVLQLSGWQADCSSAAESYSGGRGLDYFEVSMSFTETGDD